MRDENGHPIFFEWGNWGLAARETAEGQRMECAYDRHGRLVGQTWKQKDASGKSIKREYDEYDRLIKAVYNDGSIEAYSYDVWGRVASITANGKTTSLSYDYYGRVSEKREEGMVTQFSYTPWGRRSERMTTVNGKMITREKRAYDKYGRLVLVDTGAHRMTCAYDEKNRLSTQTVDGVPIDITYTKYGQIEAKYFGGKARPLSTLRYEYDKKGRIVRKTQDGIEQNFSYDKKGQLVRVTDGQGRIAEEYAYDRAGNLAWKKEGGTLTEYSYDRANQLVSATKNGESTAYAYDAAGRMIREGTRGYRYAGADKVVSVEEKGKTIYRYDYWSDGQLAHAEGIDGVKEEFLWDNLALIRRGAIEYLNEPSPTGGNPIAATGKVFFNDLLGTTIAAKGKEALEKLPVSAFGAASDIVEHQFFTGKPYVQGLGYAFLMRNYRADLGKWQTADPLGYPDGWNAFAYCNNNSIDRIDFLGGYYYDYYDLFVSGQKQNEINCFRDALSHYRSHAGGIVEAGEGLISEMKSDSSYHQKIELGVGNIIQQKLLAVPISKKSGTVSGAGDRGLECHTMGSYKLDITYKGSWTAGDWMQDENGRYYRMVSTDLEADLTGSNDWDFDWNQEYSFWDNVTKEWIPSIVAWDGTAFTIKYSTTQRFKYNVKQYE